MEAQIYYKVVKVGTGNPTRSEDPLEAGYYYKIRAHWNDEWALVSDRHESAAAARQTANKLGYKTE